MIENEHQYNVSKMRVAKLQDGIDRVTNGNKNPLRKELLTGSLIMAKEEIEKDIEMYELQNKKLKSHD
jgi:hypothetical protein